MMKYTAEYLREMGYTGYQRNAMTGNTRKTEYPLRYAAQAANKAPNRLQFTRDALGGKVRVHISLTAPACDIIPSTEIFIERPMTKAELRTAAAELAKMGLQAVRC